MSAIYCNNDDEFIATYRYVPVCKCGLCDGTCKEHSSQCQCNDCTLIVLIHTAAIESLLQKQQEKEDDDNCFPFRNEPSLHSTDAEHLDAEEKDEEEEEDNDGYFCLRQEDEEAYWDTKPSEEVFQRIKPAFPTKTPEVEVPWLKNLKVKVLKTT